MSAASSRDNPYLKGIEYTRRSYLFNNCCHAPLLPCRQRRIRSSSESTTSRSVFTGTRMGSLSVVGYRLPNEYEGGLKRFFSATLNHQPPLTDAELEQRSS